MLSCMHIHNLAFILLSNEVPVSLAPLRLTFPENRTMLFSIMHERLLAGDAGRQVTGTSTSDKAAQKEHWLSTSHQLFLHAS